jgi:hypothetical protein
MASVDRLSNNQFGGLLNVISQGTRYGVSVKNSNVDPLRI